MGTRADFYVGTGKDAEWLGSVAYDGYEWDEDRDSDIAAATTEQEFKDAVTAVLTGRRDATTPDLGWPWPWEDSRTTDYAYFFDGNKTRIFCFGKPRDDGCDMEAWPDMSSRQNVTFGARSGVFIVSAD